MTGEQGHILVVDDNRMNRIKLSRSLEQQGYRVDLAEGGEQALDMLRAEPFDVVLLDIIMPGMDGFAVLEQIKGAPALRDVPVIVISALDDLESVVRCIEMGAEDYLPKSFDPVLLRARLGACLQKKKLRDLEKAYLQQEVMLRQSEKLATLGRLSAGMAHGLNNPAAAARRGAGLLRATFAQLQDKQVELGRLGLTPARLDILARLDGMARDEERPADAADALVRSDRESALESLLDEYGVKSAWEIAPNLVQLGFDRSELAALAGDFAPAQLPSLVTWLNCTATIYDVLREICNGAERISEIVQAMKEYTFMDQAPVQRVDIHKGLENTLVILRERLQSGIVVQRDYAADLPQVEAYGSELNQVWTNIIDNALYALAGEGVLVLRTRNEGHWVSVEIEDSGPGIAASMLPHVFDPFFTTKPPGQGNGMGLNICHIIVVQRHKGTLEARSAPGQTTFKVRLPLTGVAGDRSHAAHA